MKKIIARGIATLCLAALVPSASYAVADETTSVADETTSVTVRHVNLSPVTRAEVQRVYYQIDNGALRACGASDFSLREVKQATRDSACWHDAFQGAMKQIHSPALAQAVNEYRMAL